MADTENSSAELILSMDNYDDYANRIKQHRKSLKLTQVEFADVLKVKFSTLRSWEQGKTKPPYRMWRQYKELFDDSSSLP